MRGNGRDLFCFYLPSDLVAFGIVFECDGKITTFVEFTESSGLAVSNACCVRSRWSVDLGDGNECSSQFGKCIL